MKKIILAVGAMLAMSFACFAANPESDFGYELVDQKEVKVLAEKFKELNPKEDYIAITYYKGNVRGEKIEVPEEIEGCKVIKVVFNGNTNIYVDKIIIPASVVYFASNTSVKYPQIEFLRDKDQPFIWCGYVDLTEQKTIPVDRKIIFLYPGENIDSKIYISVPEKKFTWPKNWTWAGLYKNDYLGGDNQYHWINPGFKFPDQSTHILKYGTIDFKEEEIEMSFEEGYEELPIMPYNSKIKKLILPNSLKKITKNRSIRIGSSSDYKGTIVFPEGAKITIEPGAIVCDNLSISNLKALKAMGYNTDN